MREARRRRAVVAAVDTAGHGDRCLVAVADADRQTAGTSCVVRGVLDVTTSALDAGAADVRPLGSAAELGIFLAEVDRNRAVAAHRGCYWCKPASW